ncbi:MAG: hypothetical protein ACRCT7_14760, partial [Shewanella sp.]
MQTSNSAGYSGTPLAKKLGFKESQYILLINTPNEYQSLLDPLPPNVAFVNQADVKIDMVHAFVTEREELAKI